MGSWRRRVVADRVDGLLGEERPGAPHTITDVNQCYPLSTNGLVEAVIATTREERPTDATHRSDAQIDLLDDQRHGPRSAACGGPSRSRPIERGASRSRPIGWSSRPLVIEKVRTAIGRYLDHPSGPPSSRSTRRPRSKPRAISADPACMPGTLSGPATTTVVTTSPARATRWSWYQARYRLAARSASRQRVHEFPRRGGSSKESTPRFPATTRFISTSTTPLRRHGRSDGG